MNCALLGSQSMSPGRNELRPYVRFPSILVCLSSLSLSKQYWTLVVARVTDCTFPKDPYFNKISGRLMPGMSH